MGGSTIHSFIDRSPGLSTALRRLTLVVIVVAALSGCFGPSGIPQQEPLPTAIFAYVAENRGDVALQLWLNLSTTPNGSEAWQVVDSQHYLLGGHGNVNGSGAMEDGLRYRVNATWHVSASDELGYRQRDFSTELTFGAELCPDSDVELLFYAAETEPIPVVSERLDATGEMGCASP